MGACRSFYKKKWCGYRERQREKKKRATWLINDCLFTIILVMLDFLEKCHPSFTMYVLDCQNKKKQVYIFIYIYIKIVKMSLLMFIYVLIVSSDRWKRLTKNKKTVLNIYICFSFVLVIYRVRTSHNGDISVCCRNKYTDGIFFC